MKRGFAAMVVVLVGAASLARAADVHVDVNIGVPPPPQIVLPAPPQLVVVPGSPVWVAPSVPYNFFYYDGLYYVSHDGHWFASVSAHGPWGFVHHVPLPVLAVPVHYYQVPPGHRKHHGPPPWAHDHDHDHDHGHGHGHDRHDDD
jgi:hypothetical protein